jgi:hypothetical protein
MIFILYYFDILILKKKFKNKKYIILVYLKTKHFKN